MKLRSLYIDGYKNLINCKYDIEDFNVLIGANNSGKSNVLEIFTFLDSILNGNDESKSSIFAGELPDGTRYKTRCPKESKDEISVSFEFEDEIKDITYKYWYEIIIQLDGEKEKGYIKNESFKYKDKSKTGMPKRIFEREDERIINKPKYININKIDRREPLINIINKINDERLEEVIKKGINDITKITKTPIIYASPTVLRENQNKNDAFIKINNKIAGFNLSKKIYNISRDSDLFMYFKDVLKSLINIKDISVIDIHDRVIISFEYMNGAVSPIESVSDGTLVVLSLVVYLISNEYPIVCIEEIENSIHPRLVNKLIDLIKYSFSNTQVIITTHSPVLLDMIDINELSIIENENFGISKIEAIKSKKNLIKKISSPFSSLHDVFYYDINDEDK